MKLALVFALFLILTISSSCCAASSSLSPRIINGNDASSARYPYAVSLQSSFHYPSHFCGASLVAPDVVLSAAHCRGIARVLVNPVSLVDGGEYHTVKEELRHPYYQSVNEFDHDIMLLKLDGNSSSPTVRLDNTQEDGNLTMEPLRVIGWGRLEHEGDVPTKIQELNVTYQNPCGSMAGMITPDMMCATGFNVSGTCNGDSGGPLIIPGGGASSFEQDIQVGITSFGRTECVHPLYSDVFARVSEEWHWIRVNVCALSTDPPEYFACADEEENLTFSPAPTQARGTSSPTSPTVSPSPTSSTSKILVVIVLDGAPADIGWYLTNTLSRVPIYQVLPGTYGVESTFGTVTETVDALVRGQNYKLSIVNANGNGFWGEVSVYLGPDARSDMLLAYHDADPNHISYSLSFTVSESATGNVFPTSTPSWIPSLDPTAPSISPSPTAEEILVVVYLRTDSYPDSLGWRVETTTGEVVRQVKSGFYQESKANAEESFELDEGRDYSFIITTQSGFGFSGEIILFAGNVLSESAVIAYYEGYHGAYEEYTMNFTASMEATIGVFPTSGPTVQATPSMSPMPTNSLVAITIRIKTDGYPHETRWSIIAANSGEMAFEGHEGYALEDTVYVETLQLNQEEQYFLTLHDSYGDGFGGSLFVFLGESTSNDNLLAHYDGPRGSFHDYYLSFVTSPNATIVVPPSDPTAAPSGSSYPSELPVADDGMVYVLVLIHLDLYEHETGWRVEGVDGVVVYEEPCGTYGSNERLISKLLQLHQAAEYTFVLLDQYYDGLWRDAYIYLGTEPHGDSILLQFESAKDQFENEFRRSFRTDTTLGSATPTIPPTASLPSIPVPICHVCGLGKEPTLVDAVIPSFDVSCGELHSLGQQGSIVGPLCSGFQALAQNSCGCQ